MAITPSDLEENFLLTGDLSGLITAFGIKTIWIGISDCSRHSSRPGQVTNVQNGIITRF